VRIDGRLADGCRHSIDQLLRRRVLETLGLVVHSIPGVSKGAREIGFDDAMAAEHAQRNPTAFVGEADAAIALVREQPLLGEATHHPAHRRGRDREPVRDVGRRGRP
jgi:hypothetical protein